MKTTILIVEDEATVRKVYREELTDNGFLALEAKDGREGLELALRHRPQLILLDILMPVMDGLTMMSKLRQSGAYGKTVPIVLLTNLSGGEEKIIASIIKNEPAHYLIKSDWNLNQVVMKINELLEKKI
jgi:CheY-like chemotaxis protein